MQNWKTNSLLSYCSYYQKHKVLLDFKDSDYYRKIGATSFSIYISIYIARKKYYYPIKCHVYFYLSPLCYVLRLQNYINILKTEFFLVGEERLPLINYFLYTIGPTLFVSNLQYSPLNLRNPIYATSKSQTSQSTRKA